MEITKFEIGSLSLPIFGAQPSDQFVLKGADGLGPVDINVIAPDGVFQGTSAADRELVFRIGLNPNYTEAEYRGVGQLRADLYGMLNPANGGMLIKAVGIQYPGGPEAVRGQTYGYARKFEINPFSASPEVQITIICPDKPYWEYPSEVQDSQGFYTDSIYVPNIGQVDVGFKIVVQTFQDISGFSLISNDNGEKLEIVKDFDNLDTITIDTRDGRREVSLLGVSLLGYLSEDSTWPKTLAGGTGFTFAEEGLYAWDLTYRPLYWGV